MDGLEKIDERLRTAEQQIAVLEANQPHLLEIMSQQTKAYQDLQKTMVQVQVAIGAIEAKVSGLDERLGAIEHKIDTVEKRDTFSVAGTFKKLLPYIIIMIASTFSSAGLLNLIK